MIKGALDHVLSMCKGYRGADGRQMPIDAEYKEHVTQMQRSMGNSGLRVIAMARGRSMETLSYVGVCGILDPPRPGCAEAIEVVRQAGVSVRMVTGDALETARSIGEG